MTGPLTTAAAVDAVNNIVVTLRAVESEYARDHNEWPQGIVVLAQPGLWAALTMPVDGAAWAQVDAVTGDLTTTGLHASVLAVQHAVPDAPPFGFTMVLGTAVVDEIRVLDDDLVVHPSHDPEPDAADRVLAGGTACRRCLRFVSFDQDPGGAAKVTPVGAKPCRGSAKLRH